MSNRELFSDRLEAWLQSTKSKKLADLVDVFYEKSFAVGILLLMFIPALPLPTGGVTHVFEIIAILLSLEMIWGRKTIWLPKRWQSADISRLGHRNFSRLIKKLRWVEIRSRPQLKRLLKDTLFLRITGVLLTIFCLAAFLAPPFSGLDTIPSLAAVLIALSIIFEDVRLYILGVATGGLGIAAVLVLGRLLLKSFTLWS